MKIKGHINKKINSNAGMSLAETLIAVLILLLVSSGLVTTVVIASNQYKEANRYSEAKILISTLSNVLVDELTNASNVNYHVENDSIVFDSYTSERFFEKTSFETDVNGYLIAKNMANTSENYNLLSKKAYVYDLKAKINYIYFSPKANSFKLDLEIYNDDGGTYTIYSNKQLTVMDIANLY